MRVITGLVAVVAALGIGAVSTPAATAAGTGSYRAEDAVTGAVRNGPTTVSGRGPLPGPGFGLQCAPGSRHRSEFDLGCTGAGFSVWTDCSNGYRYTAGRFVGRYRVHVYCPRGYRALRGGAY